MINPLISMVQRIKSGIPTGIPSYCTANELVLEAILEQARRFDGPVLIECTANQVNQFGGYTGMRPADFRDYVYGIANRVGFGQDNVILGGDHMGPLVWSNLPEREAMSNACELVRRCVLAGFRKVHLDTSMRLGDDPEGEPLSDDVIAERGAVLLEECESAYQELRRTDPFAIRPVYVIGSEVPIPGGTQEEDSGLKLTTKEALRGTILSYRKIFEKHNLSSRWGDIVAIVVQPGVEFGNDEIHDYDRVAASELCCALKEYDGIVFEGHSTDYQTAGKLREMVEDGIAILKVGPALTFSLREGLFALSMIENELIPNRASRSNFIEVLEVIMESSPVHWKTHYGKLSADAQRRAKKFSFSDRARYYLCYQDIENAIQRLFVNFSDLTIPENVLSQYMPRQYRRVREGLLRLDARELVKDCVVNRVEDYNYAVKPYYKIV